MWRAVASQESSVHHHSQLYSQQLSTQHVLWGCWKRPLPLVMICCVLNKVLISGQGESSEAGQTRFFHPRSHTGPKEFLVGCVLHRPDTEPWGESDLFSWCFLTCKCIIEWVVLRLRALISGLWQLPVQFKTLPLSSVYFTLLLGITTLLQWRLQVTGWHVKGVPTFIVVLS